MRHAPTASRRLGVMRNSAVLSRRSYKHRICPKVEFTESLEQASSSVVVQTCVGHEPRCSRTHNNARRCGDQRPRLFVRTTRQSESYNCARCPPLSIHKHYCKPVSTADKPLLRSQGANAWQHEDRPVRNIRLPQLVKLVGPFTSRALRDGEQTSRNNCLGKSQTHTKERLDSSKEELAEASLLFARTMRRTQAVRLPRGENRQCMQT